MADTEAETAVIASAIRNLQALEMACESLVPGDFTDLKLRSMFECMCELRELEQPVERVTVLNHSQRTRSAQSFNATDLGQLTAAFPNVESQGSYIQLVKSAQLKNAQKMLITSLYAQMTKAPEKDLDGAVEGFITKCETLDRIGNTKPITSHYDAVIDEWQTIRDTSAQTPAWYLPPLDRLAGGFYGGKMIIVAGGAKDGKTTLMYAQALNLARALHPVGYFSLEMTTMEMVRRMYKFAMNRDPIRDHIDLSTAKESLESRFGEMPLFMNTRTYNIDDILRESYVLFREHGCKIFFLDYLGLVDRSSKLSTNDGIGEITRKIKRFCVRHKVDYIVGCQLNRNSRRDKTEPRLIDLRDSGNIEQDMDVAIFLDRIDIRCADECSEPATTLIVAGNRHGDNGKIDTHWDSTRNVLIIPG